jgi:hypothetical protein
MTTAFEILDALESPITETKHAVRIVDIVLTALLMRIRKGETPDSAEIDAALYALSQCCDLADAAFDGWQFRFRTHCGAVSEMREDEAGMALN